MIITEIPIGADKKQVLRSMDCYENSPLYGEISELYEEIRRQVYSAVHPRAAVTFLEGEAYVLMTLGEEISDLITRLFGEGEYLGGMIADTLADHCLFFADHYLTEWLRPVCAERSVGVAGRMDAPNDMPMERQKEILERTDGTNAIGVGITSGLMFSPVKSMGYILTLTDDKEKFGAQHDCSGCRAEGCVMRKAPYGGRQGGDNGENEVK